MFFSVDLNSAYVFTYKICTDYMTHLVSISLQLK